MSKRCGIKLKVASPCPAKWDDMTGDDAVRHCASCDKDVFQISNMSTEQVETFLLGRKGLRTCIRFFQRADGTLLTSDCSVGKRAKRKKQALRVVGAAAIGASVLGLRYAPSSASSSSAPPSQISAEPKPAVAPTPEAVPEPKIIHRIQGLMVREPEMIEMLGDVAYDPDEDERAEELGELAPLEEE